MPSKRRDHLVLRRAVDEALKARLVVHGRGKTPESRDRVVHPSALRCRHAIHSRDRRRHKPCCMFGGLTAASPWITFETVVARRHTRTYVRLYFTGHLGPRDRGMPARGVVAHRSPLGGHRGAAMASHRRSRRRRRRDGGQRELQPRRHRPHVRPVAHRREHPYRSGKTARGGRDDESARWIEPLQIIDRHQYGSSLREALDDRDKASPDHLLIGDRTIFGGPPSAAPDRSKVAAAEAIPLKLPRPISSNSAANPEYGSTDSTDVARADSTRNPSSWARCTPANHTVVLPMPASPSTTSAEGPDGTEPRNSSTARDSVSRLTTTLIIGDVPQPTVNCSTANCFLYHRKVVCTGFRHIGAIASYPPVATRACAPMRRYRSAPRWCAGGSSVQRVLAALGNTSETTRVDDPLEPDERPF